MFEEMKKNYKNIELISPFKYALNISPLKKFHDCFLTHIKTARFVVSLIVLGKWKVTAGLQIHPRKILRRTNKARKARENVTQGTKIRRVSKARKVRRHVWYEST